MTHDTSEPTSKAAGDWVSNKDMHPITNIWGREYWAAGNISGTYRGYWPTTNGFAPSNLFWHFPTPTEGVPPQSSGRNHFSESSGAKKPFFAFLGDMFNCFDTR
jgi:hypothetical protein